MFKPFAKMLSKNSSLASITESLEKLSQTDVLIGIPESNNDRKKKEDETQIENAQLGYMLAMGDPLKNLPPRPFLEPSIEESKDKIAIQQAKVFKAALTGNVSSVKQEMEKLGLLGQNIVRDWFTNPKNNWPENAPMTVEKKGSNRPNIDTGQLRRSVTYVLRDDKK